VKNKRKTKNKQKKKEDKKERGGEDEGEGDQDEEEGEEVVAVQRCRNKVSLIRNITAETPNKMETLYTVWV
jgi:hypothetical protein